MDNNQQKREEAQSISDIKLELFRYARDEQEMLRGHVKELKQEVKDYKEEIKKQNWTILALILGVLGLSGFSTYMSLHNWLKDTTQKTLEGEVKSIKNQISQRLDDEFKTPKISAVIIDKAKEYTEKNAKQYIERKIDASFKPFSDDLNAKFLHLQDQTNKFNLYLENTKDKYSKEYSIVTDQLNILKERNKFTRLGDEANAGSAKAFDELMVSADSAKQLEKTMAEAEIARVKNSYLSLTRLQENDDLTLKYPDGTIKRGNDISTSDLLDILRGKSKRLIKENVAWKSRALAAKYLADRRDSGLLEVLLESSCSDQDLEVRKWALESFVIISDGPRVDVLECKFAKDWWREHRQEVEKRLIKYQK